MATRHKTNARSGAKPATPRGAGDARKRAERPKPRPSREYFSKAFDAAPEALAIVRASDRATGGTHDGLGVLVEINGAFERLLGWSAAEAIGRSDADLDLWVDHQERDAYCAALNRDRNLRDRRVHLRGKDGAPRICTLSATAFEVSGERHLIVEAYDIADFLRAGRELQQSERKYRALFETSPEAIAIARRHDGVHLEVNETWTRLIGYPREAALGRSALELGIWSVPAERDRLLAALQEKGRVSNFETRFLGGDGKPIDVLLSCEGIEIDGVDCLVHVWRDVTDQKRAARAVAESEERFSKTFFATPDAIVIGRIEDGRIVEVNRGFERMTGYTAREAVGKTSVEMGLWAVPEEEERMRARVRANRPIRDFEGVVVTRSGERRAVLYSVERLDFGDVPHGIVVVRDVTEQRRASEAIVESERRYRALFDSALDGIFIVSSAGVLLDVNPIGCRGTGYARHELLGRHFATLFDDADVTRRPLRVQDVFALGSVRVERTVRCKDGSLLEAEILAGPLPDGNIQAIVRDVSERKRNEQLLFNVARGVSAKLGAAFFSSLVEHLARQLGADYVFVGETMPEAPDRVSTLAYFADRAIAPNFEYSLEGSPCEHVMRRGTVAYSEHVAEQFPRDAGLKRLGVEGYIGTSMHGADGLPLGILVVMSKRRIERTSFWVSLLEIFAARAAAEIERTRAEMQVRDLNVSLERRVAGRTGELEAANRELESFSYSISHDLRAPLRAIAGFARLLREEHATPGANASRYLDRIEASATRMDQLIEDLREFSRNAAGAVERKPVDMRALVDTVLAELRDVAPSNAEIIVGEMPPACGDASLLHQVWFNLIGNALKFSRAAAAPRIELGGARNGEGVEYFVRDNGAGFDPQYANRLFGVFQRLHGAQEFEGTGVGLAIVQRIVHRHGGVVHAEGAPGQGAVFRFSVRD